MGRRMTFLDELQKMKKEMDRIWDDLFQGDLKGKAEKTKGKNKRAPRFLKEEQKLNYPGDAHRIQ